MKNQIKLGHYFGVEVGLHYSWFIIAFLIVLSVGQDFASHNPHWSPAEVWVTAVVTGALFFVTIVVHEMAHSLVAKAHGIPVKAITLFALGGVSQIEKESEDAKTEFWIGIAGPLTSLVIGAACLGSARAFGWRDGTPHQPGLALVVWLGYINLALAAFNLVPGFPLDGGRVLRAIIWWKTGDGTRATRLAARGGHWIAMLLIFFGILQFFQGAVFNGLWLAFIGWFLNEAAQATAAQMEWGLVLKELGVRDVMDRDDPVVPAATPLDVFVHDWLLRTGRRLFLVEDHGRNVALLSAPDLRHVPRPEWPRRTVGEVARPLEKLPAVPADSDAKAAWDAMLHNEAEEVAVTDHGHIEGIVSRSRLLEILRARLDFGAGR